MITSFYDLQAEKNTGEPFPFSDLKGSPVLIVNTASKCGFTPQYEGLEQLYKEFGPKGLVIIAFPSDQFAHQEPGSDEEIEAFCRMNYGISFPIMAKTLVNGNETHPVFVWLKKQAPGVLGSMIKWNFTKFLVSSDGMRVTRFAPTVKPIQLRDAIERSL